MYSIRVIIKLFKTVLKVLNIKFKYTGNSQRGENVWASVANAKVNLQSELEPLEQESSLVLTQSDEKCVFWSTLIMLNSLSKVIMLFETHGWKNG